MRPARLDGTWALSGWELGKGAIYGRVTISREPASPDEFTTTATYRVARTGETDHAHRPRDRLHRLPVARPFVDRRPPNSALREVMIVDRDWRTMEGRWFTGGYDELGIDVKLERVGAEPRVLGTDRTALEAGRGRRRSSRSTAPTCRRRCGRRTSISARASRCRASSSATPDVATVDGRRRGRPRPPGARDLFVAGASRPKALAVYDKIDSIKVKPDWAMARVGGVTFPKMLAQFEAWALQQRRRRQAGYARRHRARPRRRDVEHGGIRRHLRRR